jgi:hypothetical protein
MLGLLAVPDWAREAGGPETQSITIDILPRRQKPPPKTETAQTADQRPTGNLQEESDAPAAAQTPAEPAAEPDDPPPLRSAPGRDEPGDERKIDWQASLARAAADTVEAHAEVDSLHPDFDELRRIAAVRYAEPRTGKPPPIWENVEQDIYGRTLLRSGNCFRVLDDTNVGNRYAFETFERFLVFCGGPRHPRQKFPWVKAIVERYPYLREPDGGEAGPAGKAAD